MLTGTISESCPPCPGIRTPSTEMRDHRQLLVHRHKLVQLRTRVKNELQHLALNQGMQRKRKLWTTVGAACNSNR